MLLILIRVIIWVSSLVGVLFLWMDGCTHGLSTFLLVDTPHICSMGLLWRKLLSIFLYQPFSRHRFLFLLRKYLSGTSESWSWYGFTWEENARAFPKVAVLACRCCRYKSSWTQWLKTARIYYLQTWRSDVRGGSYRAKIRVPLKPCPFQEVLGENSFPALCSFSSLLLFRGSWPDHSNLYFLRHVSFWLWPSHLPLIRTLVMTP